MRARLTAQKKRSGVSRRHPPKKCSQPDWARLERLPRVKAIELGGESLTDDDLAHLANFPELEGLGLRNAEGLTDAGLQHLGDLDLQHLIITGLKIADAELRHLAGLKKLQILALNFTDVRGPGLEQLQHLSELRNLTISSNLLDGSFLRHPEALGKLEKVNLVHSSITDDGLEAGSPLPQVRSLALSGTQVTGIGVKHLKGWNKLEVLRLDGHQLTATAADHLNDLPKLRELTLRTWHGEPHTRVTDGTLRNLRLAPRLESLRIYGPGSITAAGIAQLAKLPNLKEVEFGSDSLNKADAQASIGQLKEAHPNLTFLVGGEILPVADQDR